MVAGLRGSCFAWSYAYGKTKQDEEVEVPARPGASL